MANWAKKGFKRGYPPVDIPNADLWRQLHYLKEQFDTLDIRWVKGHSGNKWNEFADELIEKEMAKDPNFISLAKKSYTHANRSKTTQRNY
jgi:ribonuclease HI